MKRPPADKVKALILERKDALNLTNDDLGNLLGLGHHAMSRRMNMHTREWLTEALVLCKTLGVPLEDFRQAVTY